MRLPASATSVTSRVCPGSKRTAVRFEPGQTRVVQLVAYAGDRVVHGFHGAIEGKLAP